jgi:hypothetical protein
LCGFQGDVLGWEVQWESPDAMVMKALNTRYAWMGFGWGKRKLPINSTESPNPDTKVNLTKSIVWMAISSLW